MKAYGIIGRALGLLVFLTGTAMLAGVFYLGLQIFENPGFGSSHAGVDGATGTVSTIVPHLTTLIVRLAFLLAMCVAASLIASKGIQLYVAGELKDHRSAKSTNEHSSPVVITRKKIKSDVESESIVE